MASSRNTTNSQIVRIISLYLKVIGNLYILSRLPNYILRSVERCHAKKRRSVDSAPRETGEPYNWRCNGLRLIPPSAYLESARHLCHPKSYDSTERHTYTHMTNETDLTMQSGRGLLP